MPIALHLSTMTHSIDRRSFIGAGLCAAALPSLAFGRAAPAFSSTKLHDDIWLIAGAGANVVAVKSRDGVALVDGGLAANSDALLSYIASEFSSRPVNTLFNTHWHPEQTGSNARLGNAGAKIVAHENTRLWLRTQAPLPQQPEQLYGPLPVNACPNDTFYTKGSITLADKRVDYGYLLQAHTDGDMYAFFRDANVLAAGGAVSSDRWPLVDWQTGGWIGGMANGLKSLVGLTDAGTKIAPADGPVLTRAELQAQAEMYATIFGRLQKSLRQGLSPQEAVELKPTKEFKPEWGNPDPFVEMAFKSLWGHFTPDA